MTVSFIVSSYFILEIYHNIALLFRVLSTIKILWIKNAFSSKF